MKKVIKIKKGADIKILGNPNLDNVKQMNTSRYALLPQSYRGISPIPKLEVEVGQNVLAGEPIFYDKKNPNIKYVSPVSGEFIELNRGEKRAISELVFLADRDIKFKELDSIDISTANREEIVSYLLKNGGWSFINKRPYDVVADPEVVPRDIFVSTFDSSPLAVDNTLIFKDNEVYFEFGIKLLSKLTSGNVHLGVNNSDDKLEYFNSIEEAKVDIFEGKHPAGNVGVQIHHISPIKTGDTVWTLLPNDVIALGKMIKERKYDTSRYISICGSSVENPYYAYTYLGANVGELVKGHTIDNEKHRFISGNVLTGQKINESGFVSPNHNQITVIKEGNYNELFGWLMPSAIRPTVSRSLPGYLFSKTAFQMDTNTHGEKRAFVVTGQYEDMLPMDIYLQYLIKAILVNDYEKMEGLGLLELSEEDVALCEFACTSKQPLQAILREGLEMMREQE